MLNHPTLDKLRAMKIGGLRGFLLGPIPLGENQVLAPFAGVLEDKPGDGRDGAVPGPDRFGAVAIIASAYGQFAGLGAVSRRFCRHGRVRFGPG